MAIKVNGKDAKLISEGAELSKQIKLQTDRLAEIKALLSDSLDIFSSETYVTKSGAVLDITERRQYNDMKPKEVLKTLKLHSMADKFPEVVKVLVTPLKRFLPEDIVDSLREEKDPSLSWSFK